VPNPRSVPLFRCCFPSACGAPPAPGLQENSTSGLWLSQGLSLSAAALEMPNSLTIPEGKQYRVRRKPLPRKKPLNDASGANRFAISSTVITDLDIFRLRPSTVFAPPLFPKGFCSTAKSFPKISGSGSAQGGRPSFYKIPLWGVILKTHFSYRQERKAGRPPFAGYGSALPLASLKLSSASSSAIKFFVRSALSRSISFLFPHIIRTDSDLSYKRIEGSSSH